MDMKNINTFIYTAELGSFTKAAELLGYSQSTVSFQIRQLEEELGTVLFERSNRTVTLTDRGKEILRYAHRMKQLAGEMQEMVQPKQEVRGHLLDRHVGFAVRGDCRKTVCSFAAEVPGGYDENRDRRHG